MAHLITFTGTASEKFNPTSAFMVSVHGTTSKNYTVKTLPEQEADNSDWLDAEVMSTTGTLSTANPLILVNAAVGYKYRIEPASGNVDDNLNFYYGTVTTTKPIYG